MPPTPPPLPKTPPPIPAALPLPVAIPAATPYASSHGVYYSKWKLVKTIILMLVGAMILLPCGGLMHPRWFGWCIIAIAALSLLVAGSKFLTLFRDTPVLVFSPEGLVDHSNNPPTMILWANIQKVTLHTTRTNGITKARKITLNLYTPIDSSDTHKIDLDELKGNPTAIAETVLVWANANRGSGGLTLQDQFGDGDTP